MTGPLKSSEWPLYNLMVVVTPPVTIVSISFNNPIPAIVPFSDRAAF